MSEAALLHAEARSAVCSAQAAARRIAGVGDPLARYQAATALLADLEPALERLTLLRATSVAELHEGGLTLTKIGELVGLSRGRAHQLAHAGRGVHTCRYCGDRITVEGDDGDGPWVDSDGDEGCPDNDGHAHRAA